MGAAVVPVDQEQRGQLQEIVVIALHDLLGGNQLEPQDVGFQGKWDYEQEELQHRLKIAAALGTVLDSIGWPGFNTALGFPRVALRPVEGCDLVVSEDSFRALTCLRVRAETVLADYDEAGDVRDDYVKEVALLASILDQAGAVR